MLSERESISWKQRQTRDALSLLRPCGRSRQNFFKGSILCMSDLEQIDKLERRLKDRGHKITE